LLLLLPLLLLLLPHHVCKDVDKLRVMPRNFKFRSQDYPLISPRWTSVTSAACLQSTDKLLVKPACH
jgi:hypothetical protein